MTRSLMTRSLMTRTVRTLALVLGDQLSADNPALQGLVPTHDRVLMIEAPGEGSHVWSHKARITIFLSAMRHFRDELRGRGFELHYISRAGANPKSAAGTSMRTTAMAIPKAPRLGRA
jgi:deoxyribodipyrimidine photolyase-related protein